MYNHKHHQRQTFNIKNIYIYKYKKKSVIINNSHKTFNATKTHSVSLIPRLKIKHCTIAQVTQVTCVLNSPPLSIGTRGRGTIALNIVLFIAQVTQVTCVLNTPPLSIGTRGRGQSTGKCTKSTENTRMGDLFLSFSLLTAPFCSA